MGFNSGFKGLMKPEFSQNFFRKILKYKLTRKSVQREPSCSMQTHRQTDMTKLTVPFHSFVNPPNKVISVAYPAHSTYWPRLDIHCGSQVATHLHNLNNSNLYSLQPYRWRQKVPLQWQHSLVPHDVKTHKQEQGLCSSGMLHDVGSW